VKITLSVLVLISLLTIPLVMTGCQRVELPVKVAISSEPISLDPFNVVDHLSPIIQQAIFEGLLTLGENGRLLPQLAKEYSLSPDGREITFLLREGVTFHDGSNFDAEAVKINFNFLLDAKNEMARRHLFDFVTGIKINSRYSITFVAAEPHYAMPYFFAHPQARLKSARELEKRLADSTYNLTHTAVGTGPYKLRQWYGGKRLEIVPNEQYWDQDNRARAAGITFLFLPDAKERLDRFRKGELDMIYDLTDADNEGLRGQAKVQMLTLPTQGVYYIGFDMGKTYLSDVRVRQAMNYALDKALLLRSLAISAQPLDSPVSKAIFGHSSMAARDFDLSRARALMAQAGLEKGFDLTLHTSERTFDRRVADKVAAKLAAINITLQVVSHSAGDLYALREEGGAPMWVGYAIPYGGEVDEQLRTNFPMYEALLDAARATVDLSRALDAYKGIQEKTYSEAPWLFLFSPTRAVAVREGIAGLRVCPSGVFIVRGVYRENANR